jgi:hypothetical protein
VNQRLGLEVTDGNVLYCIGGVRVGLIGALRRVGHHFGIDLQPYAFKLAIRLLSIGKLNAMCSVNRRKKTSLRETLLQ